MNQSAERHLAKAETYIGKGESFYRKAADEILAAKEADPSLSTRDIAARVGLAHSSVARILKWAGGGAAAATPFARVEGDTARKDREAAKRVLREAPMETVEKIISDLPPKRQRQVAAAAGDEKAKKITEMAEAVEHGDFDFDKVTDLGFWPSLYDEKRKLLAKLAEMAAWLAEHGDKLVPDPEGKTDPELARDIMLGTLTADKGEIDLAFSELGVGTSIEEGMSRLLRDN